MSNGPIYIFLTIINIVVCAVIYGYVHYILSKSLSKDEINNTKRAIKILFSASSLFLLSVYIYFNQDLVCDKTKDNCYSDISGIRVGATVKISDLYGITMQEDRRTTHGLTDRRVFTTRRETVYMPTLITKDGEKIAFYTSPTKEKEKAERDRMDFRNFLKSSENNLKLKNYNNDFVSF